MKRLNKNYAIILIFLCVLCFLFPWSGDDWAWGSSFGAELFNSFFKGYNGRYLGNLLVLALTRSRILRAVVMAGTYTALMYLTEKIAGESKGRLSMIAILLLCMPARMFAQAMAWTSGFSNYVPSIVISLLYIFLVRDVFDCRTDHYPESNRSGFALGVYLLLGLAGSLFIEHVTIYNLCLGVFVLVYGFIRFKRVSPTHIAFSIGSIAGAALMFSNGAYRAVAQHTDWYRSMARGLKDILDRAYTNSIYTIIPFGFIGCLVLMLALCVAACLVSCVYSKKWKVWHDLSLAVIVAYSALAVMGNVGKVNHVNYWRTIEIVATVLYLFAWVVFILTLPLESPLRMKYLLYVASAVIMDGCLLFVTPIGPRCLFGSYVFFSLLAVSLMNVALENVPKNASQVLCDALTICAVVCAYYIVYIYGTVAYFDNYRLEKARADVVAGNTTIQVENMIYDEYVWNGNPDSGTEREENFKMFYGIEPEIRIENVY